MYKTKQIFSHVLMDPLEQFAITNFLVFDTVLENPRSYPIKKACPYDFSAFIVNSINDLFYQIELFYFWINTNIFANSLTTSITIIIFWFCLVMLFNNISINNEKNRIVSEKHSIFSSFNVFTIAGNILTFFFSSSNAVVKTILKANTSLEKKEYFSVLYFLFLFITLCNVGGLIPYTFTLTSSCVVAFFFAATHFIGINLMAIYKNGWKFFNMFLPSGVPIIITPFLVLIELISYIAKVFSLSIRLFANMMAGHALLKILIGFSWAMLANGGLSFFVPALIPWAVVTAIIFLEILIAFLQSYVFTVLVAIYINDVFSSH